MLRLVQLGISKTCNYAQIILSLLPPALRTGSAFVRGKSLILSLSIMLGNNAAPLPESQLANVDHVDRGGGRAPTLMALKPGETLESPGEVLRLLMPDPPFNILIHLV